MHIYYLISPFDYIPFFEIETIKVIITNLVGLFQSLFRTLLKLYQSYKAHIVRCTEVQRLVKGEKFSSLDTIPRLIFSHHCTHAVDRKVFIRGHLKTTFTRRWVVSPKKLTFCQHLLGKNVNVLGAVHKLCRLKGGGGWSKIANFT